MTKVDVIITCYNKGNTINRAIKSVMLQTLEDFFCVVVDDGSTDDSWQVINDTIKDDKRFAAIKLKNSGVANARNAGIVLGSAPFVTCLDGDDGLESSFLQTCYDAFLECSKNIGIVYTDVLLAHIDNYFTVARWKECEPEKQFEGHNQVPCCNMFRRDIFERLGGYRQRYAPRGAGAEDAELWLRFFKLGYNAKKITNEPLFIYNTYGGLTQNTQYKEVNWTNWHTTNTFASLAKTEIAHPIYERDNPEISIIIPVGPNHEHYLIDALDSIEAQTFQSWEVVVVWDTKNTEQIAYYKNAYPYIKLLKTKGKRGAGYARNLGAKNANGDYLVFLDCDDHLQPGFLKYTLGALKHFDADWVYTDLYTQAIYNEEQFRLKVNELNTQGLMHKILRQKGDLVEFVYPYQCPEWDIEQLWTSGIAGVTGLYKKEDFELVDGFDESNNREDWDFHMRLAKAGKCGLRLPIPLYTYRLHTGIRREYKDVAITNEQRKLLKQKDVERIHETYKQKELEMACTSCKKTKINIPEAQEEDLTILEYTGSMPGGSIRGVTGKVYPIQRSKNETFFIQMVHPSDAQGFVSRGIFKPVKNKNPNREMITSPTPQKVEVVEMTREERIRRTNEFAAKAAQEAREAVEKMFGKTSDSLTEQLDIASDESPNNFEQQIDQWWYSIPETYSTIANLKHTIEQQENLTQEQVEKALEYELANKNRKGAIGYLESTLDNLE